MVDDAAGGAPDTMARLIGPWLSERLGQPVIIDNRPGAGTTIATETVVQALPDGHTLLAMSASQAIAAALYDKLNFNLIRDIAPVAGIARGPLIIVVNPSFPAKSVQEFIAYAKANPGAINMASAGIGTAPHMAGELFKMMTSINMLHVPFRGGPPALTAVLGGQVQVYFVAASSRPIDCARWLSRPRRVGQDYQKSPQSVSSCRTMRPASGLAWGLQRARLRGLSTGSTQRSTSVLPIPR